LSHKLNAGCAFSRCINEAEGKMTDSPAPESPDLHKTVREIGESAAVRTFMLAGLFVLAMLYTLHVAKEFFLPVAVAVLLNMLFSPVVRWFNWRLHVPNGVAAALVMLALLGVSGFAVYRLAAPAAEWASRGPTSMKQLQSRVHELRKPMERMTQAAEQVQRATGMQDNSSKTVTVAEPSLTSRVFGGTRAVVEGAVIAIFLAFFLLAAGDLFLQKLIKVLPGFSDKRRAVEIARETEAQISVYMLTTSSIHVTVGLVTGVAAWLVGLPNPALWGVVAMVLNFVPYVGPIFNALILLVAGLITFDSVPHALIAPVVFLGIHILEADVITPMILGHRLSLNTVAVFGGVTFWWFIWGIPGAIIAVPMLAATKIVCDHFEPLMPIGEFLGK
jgi:predicted PurR-regulated permease PerM